MPVAVRGVAVLAESRVVVEPGIADLGEGQRRPERDGDLPGPAGVYRVADVPVLGSNALDEEEPSFRLAVPQEGAPPPGIPVLSLGGEFSGRYQFDAGSQGVGGVGLDADREGDGGVQVQREGQMPGSGETRPKPVFCAMPTHPENTSAAAGVARTG